MEAQDVVKLVAMVSVDVIAILICWLLAMHRKDPKLKKIALYVGLFGLPYIGLHGYYLYEKNAPRPDFVTDIVGPASGGGGATRDVNFFVIEAGEVHHVELTARAEAGAMAKGKIELYYKLTDAPGKVLAEAFPETKPAEGRMWLPVSFSFTPEAAGEFKLRLEIPGGVDSVHLVVKEPR